MRRMQRQQTIKALLVMALGFFLYSRIANGTLYFYISERFAWLTGVASVGFLVVGLAYRQVGTHGSDDGSDSTAAHIHGHAVHTHSHGLSRGGILLVLLPILLGVCVRPQALGTAALTTRDLSVGRLRSAMPASIRHSTDKAPPERNVMDWVLAFQAAAPEGSPFAGVDADVVGFVYHNQSQDDGSFWAIRYVVSCCVADATPVGLAVRWPQSAQLEDGTWVRVVGQFAEESGQATPALVAQRVEVVPPPNQPYLYP